MSPSDGILPPTDAATEKQLTEVLQDLNRKLRNYFEIDVNQNTNAIAKLVKKISTLDATNANLEKTLKEIPDVTKQVAEAVQGLNKLKELELTLQQKKDYEKKQSEARAQAGQEFDRKKAREKEILETFTEGPAGSTGFEAIIGKSVEAIFSKKARDKLSEELKEYGTALKNKQNNTPEKEEEERQKYIDEALAKKGLKNEYSLETVVGTSVEDKLIKFAKKESDEKKQPPVQVVLNDINKPALNKLLGLFSSGPTIYTNPIFFPPGDRRELNAGKPPARNVTPPSTSPKGPKAPSLPPGKSPLGLPSGPTAKTLPAGPTKPLLGPGNDVIDIGGPSKTPNLNPNRPAARNVTPSKSGSTPIAPGKMLTSGSALRGGMVPYIASFLFGGEIDKAMNDYQVSGKSIRQRIEEIDTSLFGPVDGQSNSATKKINPGGSLMETAEPEGETDSTSVAPYGSTLSGLELPQIELPEENTNLQELTETLKLYTNSVNSLIESNANKAITGEAGGSTTLGSINNNSAVNNIIYNAENRININRDMFKETIKFNYKLLK